MREPWKVFFSEWEHRAAHPHLLGRAAGEANLPALTDAASHAARATIRYLRDEREWSLVNSHLLVAALVQETTEWTLAGADDPDVLRASLHRVWRERSQIGAMEEQGQRLTAMILTGGMSGVLPVPSRN